MSRVFCLCLVLMLSSVPVALAGDWGHGWLGPVCWPDCVGGRCCDDYDAKPLPCPRPVKCFECDDYCPRPLPCAVLVKKFCVDDYCPKCLPPVCGPPRGDLVCPPPMCPPTSCAPAANVHAAVPPGRTQANADPQLVKPGRSTARVHHTPQTTKLKQR